MTNRKNFPAFDVWPPDWLPDRLLPPGVEPVFTMAELCDLSPDEYARVYYRRSGRFLGIYGTQEEADQADPYRFVRPLLGGKLPWEQGKKR